MGEKKYLIYKISGGLCHMLGQINNAIYLSKVTNRTLIIDCFAHAFSRDFNNYFNIPDFHYNTSYDCLYQDESLDKEIFDPYIRANAECIKEIYYLNDKIIVNNVKDLLENNDKIIYFTYMKGNVDDMPWYIKVNKNIVDKISNNKISESYIGVHLRNTPDKTNEIIDFIPKIQNLSLTSNMVYFATDDCEAFDKLNKLLGSEFKIIQYTKPIKVPEGEKNIHYSNPNKDEIIMNALIDMYHLTYSTHFIPSINSSFSKRVMKLRKNDNFFN